LELDDSDRAKSAYDVDNPETIQGRDEVDLDDRSLAALRLQRALDALDTGPQRILMPGAGAGRYARAVARYRPESEVVGGDLSVRAVEEAEALGGGPTYQQFDAETIPFDEGSFDAVLFFDLLEHVPSPERLLRECRRVLRTRGVLHFFVPLEAQSGTLYDLFAGDWPIPIHAWKRDHVGHIQRFRDADVLRLATQAGFVFERVDHSFHLVGQVHDIIDYWQRERRRGGHGYLPLGVVDLVSRIVFVATWRGSFFEDRLYGGRFLASGLHVTARGVH
jgi:SAM-dependent methyltransferase